MNFDPFYKEDKIKLLKQCEELRKRDIANKCVGVRTDPNTIYYVKKKLLKIRLKQFDENGIKYEVLDSPKTKKKAK